MPVAWLALLCALAAGPAGAAERGTEELGADLTGHGYKDVDDFMGGFDQAKEAAAAVKCPLCELIVEDVLQVPLKPHHFCCGSARSAPRGRMTAGRVQLTGIPPGRSPAASCSRSAPHTPQCRARRRSRR